MIELKGANVSSENGASAALRFVTVPGDAFTWFHFENIVGLDRVQSSFTLGSDQFYSVLRFADMAPHANTPIEYLYFLERLLIMPTRVMYR